MRKFALSFFFILFSIIFSWMGQTVHAQSAPCTVPSDSRMPPQGDYCFNSSEYVHYCYGGDHPNGRPEGQGSCGTGQICTPVGTSGTQAGACVQSGNGGGTVNCSPGTTKNECYQGSTMQFVCNQQGIWQLGQEISSTCSTGNQSETLTITTTTLPNGTIGQAYPNTPIFVSSSLTGNLGSDYGVYLVSGNWPGGLQFLTAANTISGTPQTAGSYTFSLKACRLSNQAICSQPVSYTITIAQGTDTLSFQYNNPPPSGTAGVPYPALGIYVYSTNQHGTVDASYATITLTPSNKNGLSLTNPTGVLFQISGTPQTAETDAFTLKACVVANPTNCATQSISIVINANANNCSGTTPNACTITGSTQQKCSAVACRATGAPCGTSVDCFSNLSCISGTCTLPATGVCTGTTPNSCLTSDGKVTCSKVGCFSEGAPCTAQQDCIASLTCTNNKCTKPGSTGTGKSIHVFLQNGASHAKISGATVKIKNTATDQTTPTQPGIAGEYIAANLPNGTYTACVYAAPNYPIGTTPACDGIVTLDGTVDKQIIFSLTAITITPTQPTGGGTSPTQPPTQGGGSVSPTTSGSLPDCDANTCDACQPPANTCGANNGTKVCHFDHMQNGSTECTPRTQNAVQCTFANCTTGFTCSNNQCVNTQTTVTPTTTTNPSSSGEPTATTSSVPPTTVPTAPPSASPTTPLTGTPAPGETILIFTIGLDGIGAAGDHVTPSTAGSNKNPVLGTKQMTVEITGPNGTTSKIAGITYDKPSGLYKGVLNIGIVPPGNYTIKIKTDKYLKKTVLNNAPLNVGTTVQMPSPYLVAGDINGDNLINALDYNIFLSCSVYSKDARAACGNLSSNADVNDDGRVDALDYNLFLREFPVQHGD